MRWEEVEEEDADGEEEDHTHQTEDWID